MAQKLGLATTNGGWAVKNGKAASPSQSPSRWQLGLKSDDPAPSRPLGTTTSRRPSQIVGSGIKNTEQLKVLVGNVLKHLSGESDEHINSVFKMHDHDGDGVWDKEELTSVLKMQRHGARTTVTRLAVSESS